MTGAASPSLPLGSADPPRSARAAVLLVFASSGLLFGAWAPRIPEVKAHLGLSSASLGLALLAPAVGSLVALRFVGRWCARYGSRPTTRLTTIACCALAWLPGVAQNLPEFCATLFVLGSAIGAMDVAMNAQAVTVEAAYRRPVMSSFHAGWSIGTFTGTAIGDFAAGAHIPIWAAQGVLGAVLAIAALAADRALLVDPPHDNVPPARWRPRLRLPPTRLLLLGLAGLFALISEGAVGDWSGVLLREHLHVTPGRVGLAFAGFSIAMTAGRLVGDRLVHRFGARRCIAALSIIGSAGLAIGISVNTLPGVVAGFVFFGLGLSIMVPVLFSAAADSGPSGPAIATVASLSYTGFLLGPAGIGVIAQAIGLDATLKLLPVLTLAGGGLGILAIRRIAHWQVDDSGLNSAPTPALNAVTTDD
jgi:MFS family permease